MGIRDPLEAALPFEVKMKDLKDVDDKTLVAELNRRKAVKRAEAWEKIDAVQTMLLGILYEHHLSEMKWSSCTDTIETQTEDFFESLWGACGGNDISKLLKDK